MRYDRYNLCETAQTNKVYFKENLQKMIYCDMHCDTITKSADLNLGMSDSLLQSGFQKLKKSGCAAQCFAIFTESDKYGFLNYLKAFEEEIEKDKDVVFCKTYADVISCINDKKLGAILTAESLSFTGGDLNFIKVLKEKNVKMASLVWNNENEFAYPNLIFEKGLPVFEKSCTKGLKERGREALCLLDESKIIIDISHLSDGGAEEILTDRKIPVVASHSNSREVLNVSRNLPDSLIKKIADCGGAIGVNFCKDFTGEDIIPHIKHIIKVGGEDAAAFGSDFDGIPENPDMPDCTSMPELFDRLIKSGISARVLEKLAYKNFLRVFKEVCG